MGTKIKLTAEQKRREEILKGMGLSKLAEFARTADEEVREVAKHCAQLQEQLDAALIQVEEFKTLTEKQAVQLQDLEETLAKKDRLLNEFEAAMRKTDRREAELVQLRQDYNYENQRRQFAENKLHNAEIRLIALSSAEQEINDHKATMQQCGIRIDRHGSAS